MSTIRSGFDWKLLGIALLVWLGGTGLTTTLIISVLGAYHKYQHFIDKFFERVV